MSKRHYIIPIFVSHQGCPHNCVFCNQNSITGHHNDICAPDVVDTIESYLKTMNKENSIVEISFFGGTFTAISPIKQEELLKIAYKYKSENKVDYIRLSTRPDYIDDEILTRLKQYSVDIIELGVQSMDDDVLRLAGRGHVKSDTINASILIKKYGFKLGHQIMIGLPGDTAEKDINTALEVVKQKPDMCRIYPSLVLKDTPMEIMYKRGLYKPYSLKEAVEITKQLYIILNYNDINIIRVGLQATDNISVGKDIIEGPYHPAFRELIEGSIYCDMIFDEICKYKGDVTILINSKDISKLYANKKQFFIDMKKHLDAINLRVATDEKVECRNIMIEYKEKCKKVSLNDYIDKKYKEGNFYNL